MAALTPLETENLAAAVRSAADAAGVIRAVLRTCLDMESLDSDQRAAVARLYAQAKIQL